MKPERTLLVDGMYTVFSSYYAHRNMRTLQGLPTGAVFGLINRLQSLLREISPHKVLILFDSREKGFRHQVYPEYKARRLAAPEELLAQMPLIMEYLELRGIPHLSVPGMEADDLIAAYSRYLAALGGEVVIFSADKDLFQLIDERVFVFHPKTRQKMGREELRSFFGLYPEQVADYLALSGDASDNIPGVPGIGGKTALKLVEKHGSLETILADPDKLEVKVQKKILAGRQLLDLSRRLVELQADPALPRANPVPELPPEDPAALNPFFRRLAFNSLVRENNARPGAEDRPRLPIEYKTILTREDLLEMRSALQQAGGFALDVETTALEPFRSRLVGISFSIPGRGFYLPLAFPEGSGVNISEKDFQEIAAGLLADPSLKKSGHNLKFDLLHLAGAGCRLAGIRDDTMIMAALLFPNRRSHALKDLSREFLDYRQLEYRELVGRGREAVSLAEVDLPAVARYCIDDSQAALKLADKLSGLLVEKELEKIYRELEMPLLPILAAMEAGGVMIDRAFLEKAAVELDESCLRLEEEIYGTAGYRFNLQSPQQLAAFLHEKLGLALQKKTPKTGLFSTDNEVLQEFRAQHPAVEMIIDLRGRRKLLSTYVEGLLACADDRDRIHTTFNQALTATGRLSSSNPNLQNIPVGETAGIAVRRALVAPPDRVLLAADYSQIELRVMAHFAEDPGLIDAFARGLDIHGHTADLVFGPGFDRKAARQRAKIINFSIIYGSGAYALARELQVGIGVARDFIDRYFERYPGVKNFIEETARRTEENPEVRTLAGRRRPIPEITSSNRNERENGRRMAVNTIIQGSAADLIKMAMLAVADALTGLESRMLLQVHDELLFECPPREVPRLARLVKEKMAGVYPLKVPLQATVKSGPNWHDMEVIDD